ncbi:MAG: lysophospholipid acyltransferase family protein [Candidatus Omnitrophota bacterium]
MFKFYLYKLGQFLVNRLPLPVAYSITSFVSTMQYYLSIRDRHAVQSNLKCIVPDAKNIPFLAREVFRNFGKYLADFFRMAKNMDKKYIENNVKLVNRHYIDDVLKKGKGGIILTAHIGNWELGGVVLTTLGYPLAAIALPHKERPVNDLFNNQRESKGVVIVPTSIAIRKCLEYLKANRLVALLADRDFGLHGVALDFLGKKTMIPKGPAVFCLKTGAPIIPAFVIRNPDETFTLTCEEPIFPPPVEHLDEDAALLDIMKKYTLIIENVVRKFPTQWLMFREFWIK